MRAARPPGYRPPRFPAWLDALVVAAVTAALLTGYGFAAHVLLIVPESDANAVLNERDAEYFALLGGTLGGGCALGVILAGMLRRSLFAFGLLFAALLFVGLVAIQAGTFQLACEGHNDIVRHWRCEE